jgi:hypothetical protein
MPRPRLERLPFDRLEEAARGGRPRCQSTYAGTTFCEYCERYNPNATSVPQCMTDQELAARLGIGRRQVYRWRHEGIPVLMADRAAIRIRRHPAEVWGHDWLVAA